jgi:hypothetical protein
MLKPRTICSASRPHSLISHSPILPVPLSRCAARAFWSCGWVIHPCASINKPSGTRWRCGAIEAVPPSPCSRRTAACTIASTQRPLQPHCASKIGRRRFRQGIVHPLIHSALPQSLFCPTCRNVEGSAKPLRPAATLFDGLYSSSPQAVALLNREPCIKALASGTPVFLVRKGIVCSPI